MQPFQNETGDDEVLAPSAGYSSSVLPKNLRERFQHLRKYLDLFRAGLP